MADEVTISFDPYANNVVLGTETLCGTAATANTLLGYFSGISADVIGQAAYGYNCNLALGPLTCSGTVDALHSIVIGTEGAHSSMSLIANVLIGPRVAVSLQSTRDSLYLGANAGVLQRTGKNNLFVGAETGSNVVEAFGETNAGQSNTCNIVLGDSSFQNVSASSSNLILGHSAIQGSNLSGLSNSIFLGNAVTASNVSSAIFLGTANQVPSGTLSTIGIGHFLSDSVSYTNAILIGNMLSTVSLNQHLVLGQGLSLFLMARGITQSFIATAPSGYETKVGSFQTTDLGGRSGITVSSIEDVVYPGVDLSYSFPRVIPDSGGALLYTFEDICGGFANAFALLTGAGGPYEGSRTLYEEQYHAYSNTNLKHTVLIPGLYTNPTIGIMDTAGDGAGAGARPQFLSDAPVVVFTSNWPTKEVYMRTVFANTNVQRNLFTDKVFSGAYNSELTLMNFAKNRVVLYGNFLVRGLSGDSTVSYSTTDFILKNTVRVYDQVTRPYRYSISEYVSLYSNVYETQKTLGGAFPYPTLLTASSNGQWVDFPEQFENRMFHIRDADPPLNLSARYDTLALSFYGTILINNDYFLGFDPIGYIDARGTVSEIPLPPSSGDDGGFHIVYNVSTDSVSCVRIRQYIPGGAPPLGDTLSLGLTFPVDSFYDLSDINLGYVNNFTAEYILYYYGSNYTGNVPSVLLNQLPSPTRFDRTYSNIFVCKISDVGVSNATESYLYSRWYWLRSVSGSAPDDSSFPTGSNIVPGTVYVDGLSQFWINIGGFTVPESDPIEYTSTSWVKFLYPGPGTTLDVSSVFEQTRPAGILGGAQEKTTAPDYLDIVNRTVSYNVFVLGSNTVLTATPEAGIFSAESVSSNLMYPVYNALAVGTLSV